eukprot:772015-Prymnesium_polylepis.1
MSPIGVKSGGDALPFRARIFQTLVASRAALQVDGTSRVLSLSRALQRCRLAGPAGAMRMSRVHVVRHSIAYWGWEHWEVHGT